MVLNPTGAVRPRGQILFCDQCNEHPDGLRPSEHRKHMLKHDKPHKCDVPGCHRLQGFGSVNDLNRHKKSVHKTGVTCVTREFKCAGEECKANGKIWPRLDNFKQHILRMHKDADVEDLVTRSEVKGGESNGIKKQAADASALVQHRKNSALSASVTLPKLDELLQEHGLHPMLFPKEIRKYPTVFDSKASFTVNNDQNTTSMAPIVRSANPLRTTLQADSLSDGARLNNLPPINSNQPLILPRDELVTPINPPKSCYVATSQSPLTYNDRTPNKRERRFHCMYGECDAKFHRKFDLQRHINCIHVKSDAIKYDCPLKKCHRKGANGFTRIDHRTEHLREYHHRNISKRTRRRETDKEDEGVAQ